MTAEPVAFVVRFGLVLLFLPFSALDKVLGFNHAVRQAQQMFSSRPAAVAMILTGLAVEIFCSLGVVTGIADRASAFLIAGYCAATAVFSNNSGRRETSGPIPTGKAEACSGTSSKIYRSEQASY